MQRLFQRRRALWLSIASILALIFLSGPAVAAGTDAAPVVRYVDAHGVQHSTVDFKGHPTMLFLLSTWCGSCAAGLRSLNAHAEELRDSGLHLAILNTYRNEGGEGPPIDAFVARWAPALDTANVTLGSASAQLEAAYNPRHVPDIYYLIDAKGKIQAVDSAPSATLDEILAFAHQSAGKPQ